MGVALFCGWELRDWRVKNMEGKWSEEKMRKAVKVLSSLIEQHEPYVLSVKRLHPSRTSPNLNRLVGRMKALSRRKKLKIYQYSIGELEDFFYPEGRINKRQLAEIVASQHPILFHELDKEKTHRNPYHIRMFEAVALGSICFRQLDEH